MRMNKRPGRAPKVAACGLLFLLISILPISAGTLSFSAETMSADLAEGRERTILSGSARLSTEDIQISAESMELYGEDLIFALCSGNVRVVHPEDQWELTAEQLFYNRRDDIIRIHGSAVMEDRKNKIVIKGGFIEIRNSDNIIIIQIGVRILKEDLVCRSQMAIYFREEERLELTGMPFVLWKNDEYRATKIFVNLENDEVQMEGDVQADVSYEEEENPEGETE